jgi:predicted RNase H-like nuclease
MRDGSVGARVVGVDACKKGWVGISDELKGYCGVTIGELVAAVEVDGAPVVVGVDIPIGLPLSGVRQADVLARRVVGRRASSVFATPIRAALLATTHAEASALNVTATGKGLSQQAYALARKILEVDAWLPSARCAVIEVHPEVSFATMAGRPLIHPKSTWAGGEERRRLLASAGLELAGDIGPAGEFAAVDDVLDAAAAAWTAQRYAEGRAVAYPDPPEALGDGPDAAIWA